MGPVDNGKSINSCWMYEQMTVQTDTLMSDHCTDEPLDVPGDTWMYKHTEGHIYRCTNIQTGARIYKQMYRHTKGCTDAWMCQQTYRDTDVPENHLYVCPTRWNACTYEYT